MNLKIRWLVSISLAIFTILCISKGLQLWSFGSNVDGGGIGVYFLGLEINDRVLEANMPTYAIGFFIAGLCTLLISIINLTRLLLRSTSRTAV
ncbi:hypothetical protein FZC76_12740 [Sutcliffiella horikoshii]|uniref:Uncharacterized protein n=1 Tax=Sutcliffiella horikoshii TaxID=79883 RepID=A0A5D4SVQ1_9BACI|nr:hypothetical protein [Sutcliffiella horikoshii]TYS67450.1 hypothetical protein FZC76_12740 [Sutcliffiella horikoshii]